MGSNETQYLEYEWFFKNASVHVRSLRAGIKVGVKATFIGLTSDSTKLYLQAIIYNLRIFYTFPL